MDLAVAVDQPPVPAVAALVGLELAVRYLDDVGRAGVGFQLARSGGDRAAAGDRRARRIDEAPRPGAARPVDVVGRFAGVDTQFSTDQWLAGTQIEPAVRETLAPFNHVRLGGGYPDFVGVRALESDLLAVDRVGDEPPLIAAEAKGRTGGGSGGGVDTKRGIVQTYDRLHEANAAYLAAPTAAITSTDRTPARELNVGILDVSGDRTSIRSKSPASSGTGRPTRRRRSASRRARRASRTSPSG